jgi:hypothetical protein
MPVPGVPGPPPGLPPPAPARRRRFTTRQIVLLSVTLGVLLCAAASAPAVWPFVRPKPAVQPEDRVHAFLLAALTDRNVDRAMARTCGDGRDNIRAQIDKYLHPRAGAYADMAWGDARTRVVGGTAWVYVTATGVYAVSGSPPVKMAWVWAFTLEIEDGEWQVCRWTG